MASQSEIVMKVHKSKKILQINLETEEEYYEVQNESVDLIELLDSETSETHNDVEEKDKENESLFLEKTQSLSKATPIKSYQSKHKANGTLFLEKTQSLSKSTPIKAYQSKDNSNQTLFLEKTQSLPKTFQSNSGDSFLDETESWSQSFCNETPEPASLDNSDTVMFFQNKTQSLTMSDSNEPPGLSPVSSLLDDTVTLSGNKTVQHKIASVGRYLTSTPARSHRLAQEDPSCTESFNNNACAKSPILECSINSPHPSEAHITKCPPSTSREVQNLSLDKSCRASRQLSSSSNHGSLDGNIEMPRQEVSLVPVYGSPGEQGEMSSQGGQIIDEGKIASCPICYKILLKDDLQVHASGCEGEEFGFVGMSSGFLCGYCGVHIKDEDEEMEEHLLMCKAAKVKKRAEAERQGRKKTLRKGSIQSHKNVHDKRKEEGKETKTVGRSNLKRSAALVSGIRSVHKQKKCNPPTFNSTCAIPPTSNVRCANPSTSNATYTNLPTSNATCTIAHDCIPSTSKSRTKHSQTSRLVKRNLPRNPCIRTENSNLMNQATDRRNSLGRTRTAPRLNGKARKKARVICSACPLCFKHWLMEELEVHASGCLGGDHEIILDGPDEEMTGGQEGNETFVCGYCSMSVQVGEEDKENHIILCREKMAMKKWKEAAQEKKNGLRSREKKQV